MSDDQAIEALRRFIDSADGNTREQVTAARDALLVLRKELHSAKNRAEMACHQEPCGDCPGCSLADELEGLPMADWQDEVPHA